MSVTLKQQELKYQTILYQVVFENIYVKCAVFVLFAFLLLQPATLAFASSETADQELPINQEQLVPIIVEDTIPVAEDTEVTTDVIQPVELSTETDDTLIETIDSNKVTLSEVNDDSSTTMSQDIENSVQNSDVLNPEQEIITDAASDTVGSSDSSVVEENTEESVSTTTDTTTATTTSPQIEEDVLVAPVVEEDVQSEVEVPIETIVSTTTDTASTSVQGELVVSHNSSDFQFDDSQCATVGDGAYYCSTAKEAPELVHDGVFTAPDSDGDLEIYVRVNGEENKLTSNTVDDSSPYYDVHSERIVWHSLVNDRYQIVSYDTQTTEKTTLTNSMYNNMEPVAYGDLTLWQAWIQNNWEIMLFDGQNVVQLTNNIMQDVSPHMREGYIVWQTQFKDGWQVAVYNQETKIIEYIPSEGGLKVENPRFVLVYDSTDNNGDTQTLGYDLDSKTSFNLGKLPAQLPEELPEPDQTGETRALIQNKQTSKEGETEIVDIIDTNSSNVTGTTSVSVVDSGTLDLSQGTSSQVMATSSNVSVDIIDVVIPSYTEATTSSQDIIEVFDLVIPPFSASTTEEVS